jgi:beta-lactamase class A
MATSVSVYFRDLNTGHWTGINEDKTYHPSSMLKVLGLMSYLRKAEEDPSFLSKKLYYKAEVDQGQHYAPQHILSTGLHTVDELLEQTIKYSDNAVLNILDASDKDNIFNKAYHTFELPLASNVDDIDGFMSPRSYSALFRTLYNGTYLSRDDSEKALQLLTQTDFNVGLVAGLPAGVPVAHKFGEHTYGLANDQIVRRELHDCGIVYYPGHPYLICVMTEGADFSSLEKAISSLSKTVYMYVDKNINK